MTAPDAPEVDGSWVRVLAGAGPAAGAVCPGRLVAGAGADPEPLAVWRTEAGELCVVADRCPHQWSSLVEEGFVDGEVLVCAAHGWRFGTDGTGTKLAMSGRADVKAPVPVYESRAAADGVWVRLPDRSPAGSSAETTSEVTQDRPPVRADPPEPGTMDSPNHGS